MWTQFSKNAFIQTIRLPFPGPGAELVPFDSDDSDDEDSPSPSSTLQSQASHSTISSSYGSEYLLQD